MLRYMLRLRSIAALAAVLIDLIVAASPAAATSSLPGSALRTVVRLYRDFAFEATIEAPDLSRQGFLEQSRSILERYVDSNLANLILRDRQCEERTKEICRLDFLPMWDSQDPAGATVRIAATRDANDVTVALAYPGTPGNVTLNYQLVKTKSGWRIHNIRASNWSLLKILGSPDSK